MATKYERAAREDGFRQAQADIAAGSPPITSMSAIRSRVPAKHAYHWYPYSREYELVMREEQGRLSAVTYIVTSKAGRHVVDGRSWWPRLVSKCGQTGLDVEFFTAQELVLLAGAKRLDVVCSACAAARDATPSR